MISTMIKNIVRVCRK